jgi:small subunit ribosomal protein S1
LSLGVKQLEPDAWESFFNNHRIGDVVRGKVLRTASFGAFVEIAEGIEGLCHNSEASQDQNQQFKLEPGQEFDFKILKMNPADKKVGLSVRAAGEEASRKEVESYKHASDGSSATLGELMSWKRER